MHGMRARLGARLGWYCGVAMYCMRCGAQIPDDVRFCTSCGAEVVDLGAPQGDAGPQEVASGQSQDADASGVWESQASEVPEDAPYGQMPQVAPASAAPAEGASPRRNALISALAIVAATCAILIGFMSWRALTRGSLMREAMAAMTDANGGKEPEVIYDDRGLVKAVRGRLIRSAVRSPEEATKVVEAAAPLLGCYGTVPNLIYQGVEWDEADKVSIYSFETELPAPAVFEKPRPSTVSVEADEAGTVVELRVDPKGATAPAKQKEEATKEEKKQEKQQEEKPKDQRVVEEAPKKEEKNADLKAYAAKLQLLVDRFGEPNVYETNSGSNVFYNVEGVCLAQLIDFDADGDDELLVTYCEPGESMHPSIEGSHHPEAYITEVWAYVDGEAVLAYHCNGSYSNGGFAYLQRYECTDGAHWLRRDSYDGAYRCELWRIDNAESELAHCEIVENPETMDAVTTVDGSTDEAAKADFLNNYGARCVYYYFMGADWMLGPTSANGSDSKTLQPNECADLARKTIDRLRAASN